MRDIEQIDWEKVLLGQRIVARQSFAKRLVVLFARALGTFVRRSVPRVRATKDEVLFVKSMQRADYDKQWQLILECCKGKKRVAELCWRRGLSLDPIRRWARFPLAFRCASSSGSLLDRLLAALLCLYYLDALDSFAQARPREVVFFAEMRPVENVLVQWFNAQGAQTVTLQHGLYIDYANQLTINRLNYEASCAQVFLAWGQETVDLIQRFNPEVEGIICGAPQIPEPVDEVEPPCVYVVFDGDINQEQNRQLLEIGKQLGQTLELEVVVGLHPRNQKSLYELGGVSFLLKGDDYARGGVVLGHTTTQIIKLARFGKRVFKLKSGEPCNRLIPKEVCFSNFEELHSKIIMAQYPFDWSHAHIAYIGDDARSKYSEYFDITAAHINF